jgi:hypothetical protein
MNGRAFRRAIGWIPNIMSRVECDAGQAFFLTRHLLEKIGQCNILMSLHVSVQAAEIP